MASPQGFQKLAAELMVARVNDSSDRPTAAYIPVSEANVAGTWFDMRDFSEAVVIVDLKGVITFVNAAAVNLFELVSQHDSIGTPVSSLQNIKSEKGRQVHIDRLFSRSHWNGELDFITWNDEDVILSLSISTIRDHENKPIAKVGIFRDITPKKHLEERIRQAQNMESIGMEHPRRRRKSPGARGRRRPLGLASSA